MRIRNKVMTGEEFEAGRERYKRNQEEIRETTKAMEGCGCFSYVAIAIIIGIVIAIVTNNAELVMPLVIFLFILGIPFYIIGKIKAWFNR